MRELIFKMESEIQRLRWLTAFNNFETAVRRWVLAQQKANFNPAQPRDRIGRWTTEGMQAFAQATGAFIPSKHHFVVQSLYKNLNLRPETRKVFEEATTAPLRAERHGWSVEHSAYNQAVKEDFDRYLKELKITPEEMTPDQARRFVDRVKGSTDPRISNFNLKLYRREILYWLRRTPRRNE